MAKNTPQGSCSHPVHRRRSAVADSLGKSRRGITGARVTYSHMEQDHAPWLSTRLRIGILTLVNLNGGCILQMLSLRSALLQLGQGNWTVEIIPYRVSEESRQYRLGGHIRSMEADTPRMHRLRHTQDLLHFNFWNFTSNFNNSLAQLRHGLPDVVVVGSDEVWHARYMSVKDNPFLGMGLTAVRHIAYAPSFGTAINKVADPDVRLSKPLRQHLPNFDHLSVREYARHVQQLVARFGNRSEGSVPVVVDPAWLWYPAWLDTRLYKWFTDLRNHDALKQERIGELLPHSFRNELPEGTYGPFLGMGMPSSPVVSEPVATSSEKQHEGKARSSPAGVDLLLYTYLSTFKRPPAWYKDLKAFAALHNKTLVQTAVVDQKASVFAWLDAMRAATCVFTNTFHGTLFSLLLHKQFAVPSVGSSPKALDLVQSLNLSKHVIIGRHVESGILWPCAERIDYSVVSRQLLRRRDHSLRWLRGAVVDEL